jgi:nucleotide-binding universal stress UspA family protein
VLAHAFFLPPELGLAGRPDIAGSLRERARLALADAAAALRSQEIAVEERLLEGGAPAEAIAALGRELDARLIVLGTHGHSAGARAFLGSVAERTVVLADRPVLIARGEPGPQTWSAGRPLKVALGIDRSAASRAAAAWVRALAAVTPCEVTMLHAYWPVAELSRLGLSPLVTADADPRVIESLKRELVPIAALAGQERVPLRLIPTQSSFAACLADEAERLGADVLVIGTHQRRWLEWLRLGSTVHPLLRATRLPVVCVPTTTEDVE